MNTAKEAGSMKCLLLIEVGDIASGGMGDSGFVPLSSWLLRPLSNVATSQRLMAKPHWLKLALPCSAFPAVSGSVLLCSPTVSWESVAHFSHACHCHTTLLTLSSGEGDGSLSCEFSWRSPRDSY